MRDELLAYLLNDLEPQQRTRIEERLNSDPIWQHELERLRSYVEEAHDASLDQTGVEQAGPFQSDIVQNGTVQNGTVQNDTDETGADNTESGSTTAGQTGAGMADAPPADLVKRTCLFVKQASAQGALSPAVLPASLSEAHDAAAPRSKRWSLLDLAIVASIFVVLGTLLLPALRESRDSARRVQCQEKLHELGRQLAQYAGQTGGRLPAIERNENAGMFAVKLVESGLLTEEQLVELLVCPASKLAERVFNGEVVIRVPNRREMRSATLSQLKSLVETMGGSFAYRIGYFDKLGNYRQIAFTGSRNSPIMADKPSYDVVGFQSPHHTGCQANVLFQDQSVRIIKFCMQNGKDRHWFLNEDQQPAAGKNELDIVLGRSETTPIGNTLLTKSIRLQRRPASNFANGAH